MGKQRLTIHHEGCTARVAYDADWQEWFVRLYVRGVLQHAATYHTDDQTDAVDTAWAMVAHSTGSVLDDLKHTLPLMGFATLH